MIKQKPFDGKLTAYLYERSSITQFNACWLIAAFAAFFPAFQDHVADADDQGDKD